MFARAFAEFENGIDRDVIQLSSENLLFVWFVNNYMNTHVWSSSNKLQQRKGLWPGT